MHEMQMALQPIRLHLSALKLMYFSFSDLKKSESNHTLTDGRPNQIGILTFNLDRVTGQPATDTEVAASDKVVQSCACGITSTSLPLSLNNLRIPLI